MSLTNRWRVGGHKYVSWIRTDNGQEQNILQIAPKFWGSPASPLAEMVAGGHPDKQGKARVGLSDVEKRRIYAWIDLNIPYYGTSETAYPGTRGSRQIIPAGVEKALGDVATRRCASCHGPVDAKKYGGSAIRGMPFPQQQYVRITNPQNNNFLLSPLAKSAGGTERCGKAVFSDTSDADYQAILKAFEPTLKMLQEKPRQDMPGSKPAETCNRGRI